MRSAAAPTACGNRVDSAPSTLVLDWTVADTAVDSSEDVSCCVSCSTCSRICFQSSVSCIILRAHATSFSIRLQRYPYYESWAKCRGSSRSKVLVQRVGFFLKIPLDRVRGGLINQTSEACSSDSNAGNSTPQTAATCEKLRRMSCSVSVAKLCATRLATATGATNSTVVSRWRWCVSTARTHLHLAQSLRPA